MGSLRARFDAEHAARNVAFAGERRNVCSW
jgi:hypothetical protein